MISRIVTLDGHRISCSAGAPALESAPAAARRARMAPSVWYVIIMKRQNAEALKVAAENVLGVKAVHDHLTWVEPMSGMAFASPEDEAARTGD